MANAKYQNTPTSNWWNDVCDCIRPDNELLLNEHVKESIGIPNYYSTLRQVPVYEMPMGLKISADVFQREMSKLFEDLPYVLVYIDDLLIVTKASYDDNLEKLKEVFILLRKKGVQLNAKKSFFATQEVEYLGYIINKQGIKPQPKKVEAIFRMNVQ